MVDGYRLYNLIKQEYEHEILLPENIVDKTIELIEGSEKMNARCSEVNRLSDPAIIEAVCGLLSKGGEFTTTCGKYIHSEDRWDDSDNLLPPVNSLFKALHERDYLGKNASVFYVGADPYTQVLNGGVHGYVFNGGEHIILERPHGYIEDNNVKIQECILIKGAFDLGKSFGNFTFNQEGTFTPIDKIDDNLLVEHTLSEKDPRWAEASIINTFQTEDEFYRIAYPNVYPIES